MIGKRQFGIAIGPDLARGRRAWMYPTLMIWHFRLLKHPEEAVVPLRGDGTYSGFFFRLMLELPIKIHLRRFHFGRDIWLPVLFRPEFSEWRASVYL